MMAWQREIDDAALREYQRGVAAGLYPLTDESTKAFLAGWRGVGRYKQARETCDNEGKGWFLIAALVSTIWLVLAGSLLVLGWSGIPIRTDRIPSLIVFAVVAPLIVFFASRKSRDAGREASRKFRQDWRTPAGEAQ